MRKNHISPISDRGKNKEYLLKSNKSSEKSIPSNKCNFTSIFRKIVDNMSSEMDNDFSEI